VAIAAATAAAARGQAAAILEKSHKVKKTRKNFNLKNLYFTKINKIILARRLNCFNLFGGFY
jgi:hypothetical protein